REKMGSSIVASVACDGGNQGHVYGFAPRVGAEFLAVVGADNSPNHIASAGVPVGAVGVYVKPVHPTNVSGETLEGICPLAQLRNRRHAGHAVLTEPDVLPNASSQLGVVHSTVLTHRRSPSAPAYPASACSHRGPSA